MKGYENKDVFLIKTSIWQDNSLPFLMHYIKIEKLIVSQTNLKVFDIN